MSVSVEHVSILLQTPDILSSAEAGVTKADFQPAGQSIGLHNSMALTAAALSLSPSVIALDWTQDTLTIGVDTALITIQPYAVEGRRGIPVLTALPTFAGQDITFQLSSGDWDVPVDSNALSPSGQSVLFEDNRYFIRAAPTIAGQSIGLVRAAAVSQAAFSFTGSDVTLTPTNVLTLPVASASLSLSPQTIALEKTWSILIDYAAFNIDGSAILFNYEFDDSIVVESASFSASGQTFVLTQSIPVTSTAISPSPQTITFRYDWYLPTLPAFIEITANDVDLLFDYIIGYVVEAEQLSIDGSDVIMYLGSGMPRRIKESQSSDRIEIVLGAPITVAQKTSRNATSVQS